LKYHSSTPHLLLRCSVLHCAAVCCSFGARIHKHQSNPRSAVHHVCCGVLRCVAVCCGVLRCVVVCCSVGSRTRKHQSIFPAIHDKVVLRRPFSSKEPPTPGGISIYYVLSSRTVGKRTPLEVPGTNSSRGVLLLMVLDGGT